MELCFGGKPLIYRLPKSGVMTENSLFFRKDNVDINCMGEDSILIPFNPIRFQKLKRKQLEKV